MNATRPHAHTYGCPSCGTTVVVVGQRRWAMPLTILCACGHRMSRIVGNHIGHGGR